MWLESPGGLGLAGAGLGATLRDYGRFGLTINCRSYAFAASTESVHWPQVNSL
jgi:hypothetical protein